MGDTGPPRKGPGHERLGDRHAATERRRTPARIRPRCARGAR